MSSQRVADRCSWGVICELEVDILAMDTALVGKEDAVL
jgi:hypothetical protein